MKLNALFLKQNTKPKSRPYKVADGNGLSLLIKPNGNKVWQYRYRYEGKEQTFTIGELKEVSLADAREKCRKQRKLLKSGVNPAAEKRRKAREKKRARANTFEALAREFHGLKAPSWSTDHAARWLRSLENNAFPYIGNSPLTEVVPDDIIDVMRKMEARGALSYTGDVLQRISAVFKYAKISSRVISNPADGLTEARKTREVQHQKALPGSELPDFMSRLNDYHGHIYTKLALRLMVLTLLRPGEARQLEWADIDENAQLITIPAERMKMRRLHHVPITPQVEAILNEMKPLSGRLTHVFPGRQNPRRPMCENALNEAVQRLGYKGRATAHGFRSTGSSVLNEQGFNPDAIERQLAHGDDDKVRAAYNRAEYLNERRAMLEWYADFSEGKQRPTINVVKLKTA